ncbi:hypothetical protein [uncultured Clostridium sp.]|uniref:hypothetical protein n=1 Tax=uncultured Clostridium sp. TaxID=59620 RepID=UPI0026008031|nr:hypothetical protein [uncultured Clostridium sp.]
MSKKHCMTKASCCNCRCNNNYYGYNNRFNNNSYGYNNYGYGNFYGFGGFCGGCNWIWPLLLLFLL